MLPSTPSPIGRDPWPDGTRPGQPATPRAAATPPVAGRAAVSPAEPPDASSGVVDGDDGRPDRRTKRSARRTGRRRGGTERPTAEAPAGTDDTEPVADEEPIPVVPVRRRLSLVIAGFAALVGVGLILGAQTSGPGARAPYAVVVFGVQLLFVLAWTMAVRPPAGRTVAGVAIVAAAAADAAAVLPASASVLPICLVAVGGIALAVLGQVLHGVNKVQITDTLGAIVMIITGVASFATLVVLTRQPAGTQAVVLCLVAAAVSLMVARLTDIVLPRPRMAPQVPRGASGVVLGAMLGTLVSAFLGRYLVGFNPTSAAIVGLVAAGVAGLADLAVNYAEAGRQMAGEAPTFWVARHMQGPLGGFALAAPGAYAITVFYLT